MRSNQTISVFQGQSAPNAPMTDQRLVKPRAEIPHASKLSLDNTTGAKASTPTEVSLPSGEYLSSNLCPCLFLLLTESLLR